MTADPTVQLYPGRTVPSSYAREVVAVVAAAPPLSDAQRDNLRVLLHAAGGKP